MKPDKSRTRQNNAQSVLQALRGATNRADYARYTHLLKSVDEFEQHLDRAPSAVQIIKGHVHAPVRQYVAERIEIAPSDDQHGTGAVGKLEVAEPGEPLTAAEIEELNSFPWVRTIESPPHPVRGGGAKRKTPHKTSETQPPVAAVPQYPGAQMFVTRSREMLPVFRGMRDIARTKYAVLIQGESGTGKELVAKAIHHAGASGRPFIAVNCPAVPRDLAESELFGHRKGAFTGALEERKGAFENANGGTLFLDEIGDFPLGLQPKLLRVLQEGFFTRVGDTGQRPFTGRVVCATNRDLHAMVAKGAFREDLYMRISKFKIRIPPLRERPEDIPPFADIILDRCSKEFGKARKKLSAEAVALLQRHTWPGNFRDLENALIEAHSLCGASGTIGEDHLLALHNSPFTALLQEEVQKDASGKRSRHQQWAHVLRCFKKVPRGTPARVKRVAEIAGLSPARVYAMLADEGLTEKAIR